jgi:hypothetical protein
MDSIENTIESLTQAIGSGVSAGSREPRHYQQVLHRFAAVAPDRWTQLAESEEFAPHVEGPAAMRYALVPPEES